MYLVYEDCWKFNGSLCVQILLQYRGKSGASDHFVECYLTLGDVATSGFSLRNHDRLYSLRVSV